MTDKEIANAIRRAVLDLNVALRDAKDAGLQVSIVTTSGCYRLDQTDHAR
jgi:hypothetical protein